MYQVFQHTADAGLRVNAGDLNELFEESGRALFSLIVANPDAVRPHTRQSFVIEGGEIDYLLFDWLNELLFTFDSRKLLLSQFDVSVTDSGLTGIAKGEPLDVDRHHLEHEVKAITYHGLKVARDNGGWAAEVIVDI